MTPSEHRDKIHAALNCGRAGCDCRKPGTTHCPAHGDRDPSLSLSLRNASGIWRVLVHCHGGCSQEAVIEALRDRQLWPPASTHKNGATAPKRKIARTYDYRDARGALAFQVVRYEPKDFRQRRPDGNGAWIWNTDGVKPILYRLPELLAAPKSEPVYVVEGEKDVETARMLGLCATCTPMGAGKASRCDLSPLRGRSVVIIADNDKPGLNHAEDLRRELRGIAANITVTKLPAHDVTDYVNAGHSRAHLESWVALAQEDARPEQVRGNLVLDKVLAFLGRFVAYPSEHAHIAHTLWCAHAHLMDCWDSTPRIAFLSTEAASGKTRALEVTELLVPRALEAVNVSAAYLFRKVANEAGAPTILYDEIDTVFGPKARENEEIRGLLNAGHRRGAVAGRCVVRGKTVLTEELPAYAAVALAGLGDLPDTILTRSVVIKMRRRSPDEHVEQFRRREQLPTGHAIRSELEAWARIASADVAWPEMPPSITDRDADCWEALLAVADAAGGDWPERARVAAVALVADSMGDKGSLGIRLLTDLRTTFGEAEALSTETILAELIAMDEAPWGDLRGKPLNSRGLAQRLNRYEVKSKNVRIGNAVVKGYASEDLHDAWKRYLPSSPMENATSATNATDDTFKTRKGHVMHDNGDHPRCCYFCAGPAVDIDPQEHPVCEKHLPIGRRR
jgi:hypothetical protein